MYVSVEGCYSVLCRTARSILCFILIYELVSISCEETTLANFQSKSLREPFVSSVAENSEETCNSDTDTCDSMSRLISVDFEVFGRVQGVFFRKYTMKTATQYGLVGWVMNTPQNTVKGQVQGKESKVKEMKEWLQKTGSPKSKIERSEFKNERTIEKTEFSSFNETLVAIHGQSFKHD
ncbi:acylphosphatase-2 isoform X1 [Lingula anatina]|uniref:acylphosphatase n=1 Tax=Lingula anatina TaxID=7574 RepID=A0A1S3J2T5_LINAN|nr:acylphosphatase-2 isoform X1 [Lingula anatina]|eukprot:XP_013404558.1 acylphosphatase-2 isoform X1 [Lingula anatina]